MSEDPNSIIINEEMGNREVSVSDLVSSLEDMVHEVVQTSIAKSAVIVSQHREIDSLQEQVKFLKELLRTGE